MAEYVLFRNGIEVERGTLSYRKALRYCDRAMKADGDVTYSVRDEVFPGHYTTISAPMSKNKLNEILARPINWNPEFPKFDNATL